MNELILDITVDGRAQSLHMDEFPLDFLGTMDITRASEIKFNKYTQKWDIWVPDSDSFTKTVQGFSAYDIARKFEVEWLQECRREECHPLSGQGYIAARRVAENYDGVVHEG